MNSDKIIGYLPCCEGWAYIAIYEDGRDEDKNHPDFVPVDEYEKGVQEGRY